MLTPDEVATLRTDLLAYTCHMHQARKGTAFKRNWHQDAIATALERVVIGKSKRLIINVPPRSGKTELAVKHFIAWCMGNFPDSEFIHASYSKRLATTNTWETRAIMQEPAHTAVFGPAQFRADSNAKDEFRTAAGGIVYATGADGTITGYGAGKMRAGFGGCFPSWQDVETQDGARPIGDIVSNGFPTKVWAYNEANKDREIHDVTRFWRNPANDIIRIVMSDGSHIDCTPDHEILTASGWVAAIHLANALDLVNAQAGNLSGFGPCKASVISNFDDAFGVLWSCVPLCIRQSLRDGCPGLARFDLTDNPNANAVSVREDGSFFAAIEYLNSIFAGEFCSGSSFKDWKCPVPQGVLHVVGLCAIREIAQPVVGGNAVKVSDLMPIGAFTYKLLCHKMRNVFSGDISVDGQIDAHIAFPITRGLKRSDGLCPADLASVRNLIKPVGASDVFPIGVFYVGHVDETFCLEVGGVNNFELSHTGAIVSNCIIIDDPHKAGEATSDTMRENVIDWFSTTMESRLNTRDTPIIVIMQRLHERDLSGWLLDGGNGEHWDSLVIPAVDAAGVSFWPDQFSADDLARMEAANAYVYAGQYMQRPAPVGGGLFKDEWWRFYTQPPRITWRSIYADTAQKTKDSSDYSVFQCWGFSENGQAVLLDQIRGKWEAPELLIQARAFWAKHKATIGRGTLRKMQVEDKVSGTGLIQTLRREGIPIVPIQRTIDKVTRAMDAGPLVESGNVLLPRDAEWLSSYLAEFTQFPNAAHDDQVDPTMDALADMLGPVAVPQLRAL